MDKNQIIFVGDIHGEFSALSYNLHHRHGISDAHIIQVGDFGVGFHKENYYRTELGLLNRKLAKNNNHLYAVRGNHDEPKWFEETNNPFGYSNITLLADYSTLDLLGKKILLVGGAISIDRVWRTEGKSYWKDEGFVLKKEVLISQPQEYDVVVTHARPGICGNIKGFHNIEGWFERDLTLKDELIKEARDLNGLHELTQPKLWYYGHFHESNVCDFNGTRFRCLDIHEPHSLPL